MTRGDCADAGPRRYCTSLFEVPMSAGRGLFRRFAISIFFFVVDVDGVDDAPSGNPVVAVVVITGVLVTLKCGL